MTKVAVRRTVAGARMAPASAAVGAHPKMTLVAEGRAPFVVPYAPSTTNRGGFAPKFGEVERGGRRPLNLQAAKSLKTMSFELIVAFPDWNQSIQSQLTGLTNLAESGARIAVNLDVDSTRNLWRLTELGVQVISRQHGSNAPTRAVCTLAFTEVSDPVRPAGPTGSGSGGGSGGSGDGDKKRPKTYVWKKGDTFPKITKRFYGDAALWRELADHNKIKHPKKVKPGTKIKLPKRAALNDGVVLGTPNAFEPA